MLLGVQADDEGRDVHYLLPYTEEGERKQLQTFQLNPVAFFLRRIFHRTRELK